MDDRFWRQVDIRDPGACWPFGCTGTNGYGVYNIKLGKNSWRSIGAHRYAWIEHNGKIPNGLFVCDECDNRACCNPEHLWLGTNGDNVRDALAKFGPRSLRGEDSPRAKLTEKEVLEIRRRIKDGAVQRRLAEEYGVTHYQISLIHRRKSWRHI